jgi:hypothetical protein
MSARQRVGAADAVDVMFTLVLGVQVIRLVAAVVGGISVGLKRADQLAPSGFRTGETLTTLGSAGDGVGLLLLLLAGALLLWRMSRSAHGDRLAGSRVLLSWLLVLTAASAALFVVGLMFEASVGGFFDWERVVTPAGFAIADLVGSLGTLVVVRRLSTVGADDDSEQDRDARAAVFAVDRKTGDVLTWASQAEARAKAPLYGVEDDEYRWYLDDGTVLQATADGRDVTFTATDAERSGELLVHLKAYAQRRGIAIDEDEADEPLAYVDPIARDHYLEMWPGWLRWLGRLTR